MVIGIAEKLGVSQFCADAAVPENNRNKPASTDLLKEPEGAQRGEIWCICVHFWRIREKEKVSCVMIHRILSRGPPDGRWTPNRQRLFLHRRNLQSIKSEG